jgi:hypothetical protein
MLKQEENVIRYKWDARTGSGYRLRYDAADRQHSFRVEDWNYHVVVDDYGCADIDEALVVLNRFFDIDTAKERSRIADWLPRRSH